MMSATPPKSERVRYGIAFGAFAGALCSVVDNAGLAVWGYRIPWSLPPILACAYVGCGGLGGGFFGALHALWANRTGHHPTPDRVRAEIRFACCAACLTVFIAIFVQRVRSGYQGYMKEELGYLPVITGLGGGMLAILLSSRLRVRWRREEEVAWQILCAIILCVLWQPVTGLYQAPIFSLTALLANVGYFASGFVVWLALRPLAVRMLRGVRLDCTRKCLRGAGTTATIGLLFALTVLWYRMPKPIDRPYLAAHADPGVTAPTPPNVVLIVMDTVRADHLSPYGYHLDTTPNLAAFADEGVRYDRAIAPSSWTLPSHASMFTGLLPTEHGAYRSKGPGDWEVHPLGPGFVTLAEILSAVGYNTGAIVANTSALSRKFGVHQGFDYYDDDYHKPTMAAARVRTISPALWLCNLYRNPVEDRRKYWTRNAEEINADVLAWLNRGVQPPLFLFVNYLDAHAPYHAHAEFEAKLHGAGASDRPKPWDPDLTEDVSRYDQEIAFVDARIGELFMFLKARSLYDDSLIIVTSDHGEGFGEHGNVGHGGTLYEEEVRVPLLVRYPHAAMRGVVEEPTSLTTIPSIVLKHLGMSSGMLNEPAEQAPGFTIMAELVLLDRPPNAPEHVRVLRAFYDSDALKALVVSDDCAELYNLAQDPYEQHDQAVQRHDLVQRAFARINVWTSQVASRRRPAYAAVTMDTELRDDLRTLGYIK